MTALPTDDPSGRAAGGRRDALDTLSGGQTGSRVTVTRTSTAGVGGPPRLLADGPAIGRERALAELLDDLKVAMKGARRVNLIVGEAGIGKTRLLRELLHRASLLDCQVLTGRAQDYDEGVSGATLRDLLTSRAEMHPTDAAKHLLSQLRSAIDGAPGETAEPPLHVLLARLLEEVCAVGPLVVALDDAHLADAETLTAMSLATRFCGELPLLVIATVRRERWVPGGTFATTLGRLPEVDGGTVVDLDPFDAADVRALLASLLEMQPDDGLVRYIYEQSRGNPLFVREALISLWGAGALRAVDERCWLVGDVRQVRLSRRNTLLHRIFQQDRESRQLARALAAFRRVQLDDLGFLASLTGMGQQALQGAFDRLAHGGIIVASLGGSYEFAHPLMAEFLYEDIGPAERRRLHGLICEHLTKARPHNRTNLLERAAHMAEAGEHGERAVYETMMEAAALTRYSAPLSAARWYQRALDVLGGESTERGDVLARQAASFWKGSRPKAAIDAGRAALELLPDAAARKRLLATVVNATYATGQCAEALSLLDAEFDRSGRTWAVGGQVPLLAQRALFLAELGHGPEAVRAGEEVWGHVDGIPPEQLVVALSHLGHLANDVGDHEGMRRAADGLEVLARRLPLGAQLSAIESAAYILAAAGCRIRAEQLLAAAAQTYDRVGWHDIGGQYLYASASVGVLAGRWEQALEDIRSGVIRLELAELHANLFWARLLEAQVLIELGEFSRAAPFFDPALLPPPTRVQAAIQEATRAELVGATGDHKSAVAMLTGQLPDLRAAGCVPPLRMVLGQLAFAATAAGDTSAAADAAQELDALAGWSQTPATSVAAGSAMSLTTSEAEPALAALELATSEGLTTAEVAIRYVLGSIGHEPEVHLPAALQITDRVGAVLWRRRIAARMRSIGVRPPAQRAKRQGQLTGTEVRLMTLLRQGLTNREISDVLNYSPKTVEAYLGRLYRKAGCRSRVELVLAMERGKLTDDEPGEAAATGAGRR